MGEGSMVSGTEATVRAVRLYHPCLIDTWIPPKTTPDHLMARACATGLRDEATVLRVAERVLREAESESLLDEVHWLCRAMFTLRRGLPVLRPGLLPRKLARLVAPDGLFLFHPDLCLPEDERFDWAGVPLPDGGPIRGLLHDGSVETHIHLGGTLPPLFYWLPLVGGSMHFDVLRRRSNPERGQASDKDWQQRIGEAAWWRLWMAAFLERESPSRLFPWLKQEWRDRFPPEAAAAPETADECREQVFEIGLEYRLDRLDHWNDDEAAWPFPDPLRPETSSRIHYAYGERRFLYEVACYLRSAYARRNSRYSHFEDRVRFYLQVRNAFHRLLIHDRGREGLLRFVQAFGRRGMLSGHKRVTSKARRRRRHRRLVAKLEKSRMVAALESQLVEPYDPDPLPTGTRFAASAAERRIEMRVSVPEVQMLMPTFGAWLDGLRKHLEVYDDLGSRVSEGSRHRIRNSRVGLVFHFIKGGSGPDAAEKALLAAKRLAGALEEHAWLRHFVVGVDAAGQERKSWPRTFLSAFRCLRELENRSRLLARSSPLRLGYTFHVGEDVDDLLTGLRHIDEVVSLLLPADAGGRLGHALALGESVDRFYQRRGVTEPRRGSHVLDLVWARGRLAAAQELRESNAWVQWLEEQIRIATAPHQPDFSECYRAMALEDRGADAERLSELELLEMLVGRAPGLDWEEPWPVPLERGPWVEMVQALQKLLRKRVAHRRICVEANPTSNLLIGGYEDYGALPHFGLVEDGIAVSLNTDDPGLFMTTLPGELAALYEALAHRGWLHREILTWLRDRIFDAEQSTFLDHHVPAGETALEILDLWKREFE